MAEIKQLDIRNLLQNDTYLIPIYQRNFAWEREEIRQLLEDISQTKGNYYLGTLVVSKNNNNQFEIIDGQQRHTTLSIINAVLKNKGYDAVKSRNLIFEAREKSGKIIDNLLINKDSYQKTKSVSIEDRGIYNILRAAQDIEDFFIEKFNNVNSEQEFVKRFYNEVIIFRAELPEKTDLNHYFEIMNNRGEQLEEHEILKAAFMNKSEVAGYEKQTLFSKIWDACSQMNCHVQMCFNQDESTLLFGDLYQDIPELETLNNYILKKELNILLREHHGKESERKKENINNSLVSIIDDYNIPEGFDQNRKEDFVEKFNSIIDFPNFLLQILKLQNHEVSLDDKSLLINFGYPHNLPDAWEFIANLLKYRVIFDKYVVKREGDSNKWSWTLKTVVKNDEPQNTFRDDICRRKIRMIEAMYQVTFPTNNYKNWLFDILKFFKENSASEITGALFLSELENQAINYYNKNNLGDYFYSGLQTPRFLFNFLDYILWVDYFDKVRGKSDILTIEEEKSYLGKINKVKDKFDAFKFVQRSSIEHLFPQARYEEIVAEKVEEKKAILNSFGNLCLISRNSNSAYNSDRPIQKKLDSKGKNESLKQIIMFSSFDGDNWNTAQIKEHHDEMIEILKNRITSIILHD